jgi:hypothetical protein
MISGLRPRSSLRSLRRPGQPTRVDVFTQTPRSHSASGGFYTHGLDKDAVDLVALVARRRRIAATKEKGASMKRRILITAALVTATVAASVGAASATGLTPDQLRAAGWTCFPDPGAPRTVCSDPGHGRPFPGNPDAPPSYNFKLFTADGTFIGTSHLIRADLYRGEPCPQTGGPYFLISVIGYYRCEHF